MFLLLPHITNVPNDRMAKSVWCGIYFQWYYVTVTLYSPHFVFIIGICFIYCSIRLQHPRTENKEKKRWHGVKGGGNVVI